MRVGIAGWDDNADMFVDRLTAKSKGNFMYLVYVLADIRDGRIDAQTIDDIERCRRICAILR